MAIPDSHEGEEIVEVDEVLYLKWREAMTNAEGWAKLAGEYKAELIATIGSASAGSVNGTKVLTYRPSNKWATAALVKQYPDLVDSFMVKKATYEFDIDGFRERFPDIAEQFRVRSFRSVD